MKAFIQRKIDFIRQHPRLDIILLLLGLTVFFVITFVNAPRASIWFDEAFSWYITQFNFIEIAQFTAVDVHPPFYYWLLKVWEFLFGSSEVALRSLSIVLGGSAITIAFALTRKLFGRAIAAVSLLFLIVSPMLIRYSDEARMYMLASTIVMAATYLLVKATATNRRRTWVFYGLLVGLGMWTHYFTALIWLSHWVWRALIVRQSTKKFSQFVKQFFTKNWIIAYVVAIGFYLPWLPFMAMQLGGIQGGGFWIGGVSIDSLTNYLTNIFYYLQHNQVTTWLALALFVVIVGLSVLAAKTVRGLSKQGKANYLLVSAMSFVPILLLFIASLPPLKSSYVERYVLPGVVAFGVFMAVTIIVGSRRWRPWARVLAVLLPLVMMTYGVTNVYAQGNYNKNSDTHVMTRELIQEITHKAAPGQPIIANSPWIFYEAVYYSTPEHPVYFIDEKTPYIWGSVEMLRVSDAHKIKDIDAFTKENPVVWYIGVIETDPEAPYESWKEIDNAITTSPVNGKSVYRASAFQTR